ncbi:MAG TPA: DUF87 domain-containing protein [Roseiflexaceae bacterium]|nr:DUF87 domain-containing protein [Roseiflexaceae bacterium]
MNQIPQLQQRPGAGYALGYAVGGCLTRSIPRNLARLAGVVLLVPQLVLLVAGRASVPLLALALLALIGSFVGRRPAAAVPTGAPETWSEAERKVARLAAGAVAAGGDVAAVLRAASVLDQLAIDYGRAVADGRPVLVSPEARTRHQLVFGGSGSGKSKFIAAQAAQAALTDTALLVIDPHEELIQDVLMAAGDLLASRGAVLLWPGGPSGRIFPWNPLWTGPGRESWQAADLVVAAVKRVWGLSDANTYIVDTLRHTAWALAGAGWTLLEGSRFLTDIHFRNYIAARADIPAVSAWVRAFDARSSRDQLALAQTTIVRLNRFHANPHLSRFLGCGVTDPAYLAALRAQGVAVAPGADLVSVINRGCHVFAGVPKRTLGEDQYLVAGLVQSAVLTAALLRRPNDPAMPALELYLDEAGAYASAEGLGRLLAEARKYKLSATVAMQGPQQAEEALTEELARNTAIKAVFATDHPEEAATAATILYRYDPAAIKLDSRERVKVGEQAREVGQFQTYSPSEQHAYRAGEILGLPARRYILKVRGAPETPLEVRTPDYVARLELAEAVRLVQRKRVGPVVSAAQIDQELAARHAWLEAQGYLRARPAATPHSDQAEALAIAEGAAGDDLPAEAEEETIDL